MRIVASCLSILLLAAVAAAAQGIGVERGRGYDSYRITREDGSPVHVVISQTIKSCSWFELQGELLPIGAPGAAAQFYLADLSAVGPYGICNPFAKEKPQETGKSRTLTLAPVGGAVNATVLLPQGMTLSVVLP